MSTRDENEKAPRIDGELALEARVPDPVVVCEGIHGHVERGACLRVRVFLNRLLNRLGGEASGNPPQLFCFFARRGGRAESNLEEVRNFLCRALVSWSVQIVRGGWGREQGLQPWEGVDR